MELYGESNFCPPLMGEGQLDLSIGTPGERNLQFGIQQIDVFKESGALQTRSGVGIDVGRIDRVRNQKVN